MADARVEQRHRDEAAAAVVAAIVSRDAQEHIAQSLANAEQRGDEWRKAVEDAAVVNWTLTEGDTPRMAVTRLIATAASEALDSCLSGGALALLHRGRIEGAEAALAWAFSTHEADESIKLRAARIVAERWPEEVMPNGHVGSAVHGSNASPGGAHPSNTRTAECGCVPCVCADDERCHGCGAKSCGREDCTIKSDLARAVPWELYAEAIRALRDIIDPITDMECEHGHLLRDACPHEVCSCKRARAVLSTPEAKEVP